MRLYYISFFYFNIILLLFFILNIDLIFLILLFIRKTYSIFKESLTEYIFQEFDGLSKEGQFLDLYENKLYVDFGLDAGLEEYYIQVLYMQYALADITLDIETYSGNFTFKWNDFNMEELNLDKNYEINFKNIYIKSKEFFTPLYYYNNLVDKIIVKEIEDEDYYNLYNYKGINKRDIEDPLFIEENEKYYYNYLKKAFLKENFYDTFIKDNYIRYLNYNNFIQKLKNKVLINKYNKDIKLNQQFVGWNTNIAQIKEDLLSNSYIKK
jgi:hypothetical protein